MKNHNVRWGILGTAAIATKVVAGMHDAKNADVTAVASRSLEKAQAWATDHNVPHAYGSYDDLLADKNHVYRGDLVIDGFRLARAQQINQNSKTIF